MTITVSSKNQIVIPKLIRQKAGIKPGMKLYPAVNDSGDIVLSTRPIWYQNIGALKGVWTTLGDPAELLRTRRDQE